MQFASKVLDVPGPLELIEYFYDENMTDGLPVVPPIPERVAQFIDYVGLPPDHVIGDLPERARFVTTEKLAINAVMAGCKPEYMPVLVATIQALCEPAFKFNHLASMGSPWPMIIVSGPIVKEIGMNYGMYLMGSGNRANATIGRAMSLVLWNCCELRPDAIQRGQIGNPERYSFCIAENPDTPWEGLNEWEGFSRDTSTVTVSSGYHLCMSRTACSDARGILAPLVNSLSRHEFSPGCIVVIIGKNFERLFVEQGWTKRMIRDYLFENVKRNVKDLKEDGRWGRRASRFNGDLTHLTPVEPGDEDKWVYMFKRNPELDEPMFEDGALDRRHDVLIVAAGGDAGHTIGFYQPYAQSTSAVTKPIVMPKRP